VPLFRYPPASAAGEVMRSVIDTRCTWWCAGRWFARRAHLHPTATVAVRTLAACAPARSSSVWAAQPAGYLGLAVARLDEGGIRLCAVPEDRAVREAVTMAADSDDQFSII
jgi:hypothetical protein